MMYLATSSTPAIREAMTAGRIGLLNTPASGYNLAALPGVTWAADNGCFADTWQPEPWLRFLKRNTPYLDRCLFAVVPDVVGNHDATVDRFHEWAPAVLTLGYPLAFVGQDGATIETTPWDGFDWWFAGGSTAWKLGAAWDIAAAARRQGKRTHMGRVNSRRRFIAAASDGYDTCDGTFLAFGPDANLPKLLRWADEHAQQPTLERGRT